MSAKIDLKKEWKHLYKPSAKAPVLVDAPPVNYLMIDGMGDPNTAPSYDEAIEALYAVSYTLKFMIKKGETGVDYAVMPLEGLWWADNMDDFLSGKKDNWKWTSMILQPEYVTEALTAEALKQVEKKKNPPALGLMRFESLTEGQAAQIMHIGPFADEGPTIEKLHAFIQDQGFRNRGRHHEIYLSDFRRTAPEKLKTIIRQPVEKI